MNRTSVRMFRGALCASALASCVCAGPALADVEIQVFPPAWYVATSSPVYHEGHASYWYGNRWYYRDGGSWHSYGEEPQHLREARGRAEPARHYYGRGRTGGDRRR
jgi:hypothetical protein